MIFEKLNNLEGKVAVITGGAGQVGYATAIRLAEQKCRVIILTRKETIELQEKINLLQNKELKHFYIISDITDTNSLKYAAEKVKIKAKRCDILINSAGINKPIKSFNLEELTDEIFDNIVITNLRGVYSTIKIFFPLLKESNDGLIINISSTAAERASDNNLAYSASKAGLNHLTKCLSRVLAPNVRIMGIVPGFMSKKTGGKLTDNNMQEKILQLIPLKRIGCADDIANTIVSCAMNIRFATGNIIVVDGGRTI